MRRYLLIGAILVVTPAVANDGVLDDIAALMHGEFTMDVGETRMIDRRVRIDAPAVGDVVFYLQINQGPELAVYRQRILVLETDPASGDVVQRAFSLNDPERWVDAEPPQLKDLTMDDMERTLPEGCEQVWTKTARGYRGYTDPGTCRIISSRTGKPRRIEAVTELTESSLSLVERGFDEQGNQLFGTKPGDSYVLRRID